jgi:hypothetical protein
MSKKSVYNLLTRAFLDPGFRLELERDILGTAARLGLELGPGEAEEVRRSLGETEGDSTTGLDQRISKSGVSLSPQAMLRQKGGGSRKSMLRVESLRREVRRQMASLRLGPGQEDKVHLVAAKKEEGVKAGDFDPDEPDYEVEQG